MNFQTILGFCAFRNVTHSLRAMRRWICGRQRSTGVEVGDGSGTELHGGRVGERAVVVETVHMSLTYRLEERCLRQQKRRR